LITNDAGRLSDNQALYSVMCDDTGTIIDDLVCFRLAADHFVWVVNVTKTDEDYQWALQHAHGLNVKVRDISTDTALLALQGPLSREVLQRVTKADLSNLQYYWVNKTVIHTGHAEVPCMISRTGYTGERGYEIMVARDLAPWIWDTLLMVGRPLGIIPVGVAARESLRTEAGLLLNGNDMDAETNPIEAGVGWVVKLSKDFVGRDAIARISANGVKRKMVGLEVQGRDTIRNGYRIYADDKEIGYVTSGPLPPSLTGRNLGLGYVATAYAETGTEIEIDIRGKRCKARIVATRFSPHRAKDEPTVCTYSPYDVRFSESHVWARADNERKDVLTLGLSDFGQRNLGDVLVVNLPSVGDKVRKGEAASWIDSYRRAFDIVSPVTGEVVEINEALMQHPAEINAYPYARSGVLKVRVTTPDDYQALMRFEQYADLTRRLQQYDEWSQDLRTT
jgi:aminomethyltransferase